MQSVVLTVFVFLIGSFPTGFGSSFWSQYNHAALQGSLVPVLGEVESEEAEASPFLTMVRERFGPNATPVPETTGDPLADDLLRAYWRYWREALRGDLEPDAELPRIESLVDSVLANHGIAVEAEESPLDRAQAALEERGFHVRGGLTRPHWDLFLWKDQEEETYTVDLGDTTVSVNIVFMADFISIGWAHFATFGRSYPGGWADPEVLYCMAESYDRDSESFQVSYLRHEGRHFADYIRYPQLDQIDLEYRGKLTELMFAEASLYDLLAHFEAMADANPSSPHALASLAVVQDLSRRLQLTPDPEGNFDWQSVSPEAIHQAARDQLAAHDEQLDNLGAATVTGVIETQYTGGK